MQSAHATATRAHSRPALRAVGRGRPRSPGDILLRACRPRQWLKNLLVALAPAAAGALTRPGVMAEAVCAFVSFCLLSSATYLVNDVRDREQDRRHPRKRFRPVAAGELAPRGALRLAIVIAALGLALAVAVGPMLGLVAIGYLTLTTSYSICWRRIVVADVVAVAAGFVVRAIGGGVATGVALSYSFVIVTSACALLIVVGKRYAELVGSGSRPPSRSTLRRYSRRSLRLLLAGAAACGCVAYASWAFARPGLGTWRELSIVPFVLWLGRYLKTLGAGAGESPEELILHDRPLLALSFVWVALFTAGVYGGP
jgi:decaprenyl-phosphate phosphoribosyltransferase